MLLLPPIFSGPNDHKHVIVIATLSFCLLQSFCLGAPKGVAGRSGGVGNLYRTTFRSAKDKKFPTWAGLLIVVAILAFSACIVAFCYYMKSKVESKQKRSVKCYLCNRLVTHKEWKNGKHRKECADKNKVFLDSLQPSDRLLKCPKCKKRLKHWPSTLGSSFRCSGTNCTSPGRRVSRSIGNARYNCFKCNFDLCHYCADQYRANRASEKIQKDKEKEMENRKKKLLNHCTAGDREGDSSLNQKLDNSEENTSLNHAANEGNANNETEVLRKT